MAKNTSLVNGQSPVTKGSGGTVTGFPDICKTPTPGGPVPIPYPNIAKSSNLAGGSRTVKVDGHSVCLDSSNFSTSTGDEGGTAGGGVASGKTKGAAHPVSYSFDVKIEGKSVVRNLDVFTLNNRNTPPFPVMQSQMAPQASAVESEFFEVPKEKCPYCDKDKHDFAEKRGNNMGSGLLLANNIFKALKKDKEDHQWFTKPFSLQAHHLICSEAMAKEYWRKVCLLFGYDINHENNGVMLPALMELACQIGVALHRGNHSKGWADDLHLPYPDAVKKKLKAISEDIEAGSFCDNPSGVIAMLDNLSREILEKVDAFSWTLTADGKDYENGKIGCAGATSLTDKPNQPCKHDRKHGLVQKKKGTLIAAKSASLKIGA
ncbi:DUF4150 domain-containing protein [Vibrio cholerae]|nr:DUF4150 domain-containing protein [Vibrio cholerae]